MRPFSLIFIFIILLGCRSNQDFWFLVRNEEKVSKFTPFGNTSGYITQNGDTVIPLDKYARCFTDTFKHYAIVYDIKRGLIGIDKNEKRLFNSVWDGEGGAISEYERMILITENNKYGFANSKGKIIIKPIYQCAQSFLNGKAKVSNDCSKSEDENAFWKMNTWFYIDKSGKKID